MIYFSQNLLKIDIISIRLHEKLHPKLISTQLFTGRGLQLGRSTN